MNYKIFYDKEPLRRLFEETASDLTGKKIHLEFNTPLAHGATGETWQDPQGKIHINVAIKKRLQDMFETAVHEMAHAKLNMLPVLTDQEYRESAELDARLINNAPGQRSRENTVQKLADAWLKKAYDNARHLCRWNTPDIDRVVIYLTTLQTLNRLKVL